MYEVTRNLLPALYTRLTISGLGNTSSRDPALSEESFISTTWWSGKLFEDSLLLVLLDI
jgi:hypothetical protein